MDGVVDPNETDPLNPDTEEMVCRTAGNTSTGFFRPSQFHMDHDGDGLSDLQDICMAPIR